MDNVAPPIVKLSDAKSHALVLPNFLLDNSYILVLMKLLVLKS